jgi:hypothetical protein
MLTLLPLCVLACAPAEVVIEKGPGADADPKDTVEASSGADDTAQEDTGEGASDPEDTGEDPDPPVDPVAVDYRLTGPYSTATTTVTLSASCDASAEIVAPTTAGTWPRIILSHGFMRGPAQMTGWAEHLASWGLEVVVPALCHASILDTDHVQNGTDLTHFNDVMGGGPVVYAGHSAGGLASLIAAAVDGDAIGLIGLDLTDSDGLADDWVGGVSAPTLALAGEPSSCNAEGSGVDAVYAVPDAHILRLTEADHCDFEDETDWMCTALCDAPGDTFSDAEIHNALLGLMTAAAMSITGRDPDARTVWWTSGGTFFDALSSSGAISSL